MEREFEDRREALEEELALRTEERDRLRERLLRLAAEFDNYRKRARKERDEVIEYANAELIKQLLPVLDNLERALTAGRDEAIPESFRQGIELIHTHACRTLERAGLEPIEAIGQLFDPDLHEAVLREPSAELPENIVVQEIQRGYSLKGRIIRHSMVSVSGRESRAESTSEGQ